MNSNKTKKLFCKYMQKSFCFIMINEILFVCSHFQHTYFTFTKETIFTSW